MATPTPPKKFNGKLQGDYTWPFAIDLPKEVLLNRKKMYTLPETFNERQTRAYITYDVSVRFVRNKLRTDYRYTSGNVFQNPILY